MAFLKRSDLSAAATLALTDELLAWQSSNVGKTATLDRLLTELGIWRVLGKGSTQSTVLTGTLTETELGSVTVPANALGANGRLYIHTLWSCNNNANAKTARVRYSGTAGTIYQTLGMTAHQSLKMQCEISNRNATNSQVGQGAGITGLGATSNAIVTSAVATTSSSSVSFTGTLANTGDNMALESYLVMIIKSA